MNQPLGIACLVIVIGTVVSSIVAFQRTDLFERFLFSPSAILRGREYWRMVTSALVHANGPHLAFNMIALYSFGTALEIGFGPPTLLAIYLGAILGGSLVSLVLHRNHEYSAVGASGGVCGILFAYIFLVPGGAVEILFIPIPIPGWVFAIAYLVYSFFGLRRQAGRIGHDAHLGGAVIGLLVTTAMYPKIVVESPELYAIVMGLTVLMIAYLYKFPLYGTRTDIFSAAYWHDLRSRLNRRSAARRAADDEMELDRLLKKISESGMESLSNSERKRLDEISRRRSNRER
jgi:membrane associated rhomboid family serine protease